MLSPAVSRRMDSVVMMSVHLCVITCTLLKVCENCILQTASENFTKFAHVAVMICVIMVNTQADDSYIISSAR